MTKLLIRFLVTSIVLTGIASFLLLKKQQQLYSDGSCNDAKAQKITLSLLNDYLSPLPAQQWQARLKKISPQFRMISILPLSKTDLTPAQRQQLSVGQWVCQADSVTKQFKAVYKLTPNPNYVYRVYDQLHHEQTAQFKLGQLQYLLEQQLVKLPRTAWKDYLKKLPQQWQEPVNITLHQFNDLALMQQQNRQLREQHWLVDFPQQSVDINTVYSWSPTLKQVFKYGPIHVPFAQVHQNILSVIYLFIIFQVIALLMVLIFARSLKKLNRLASDYGQGQFNQPVSIAKSAILYPLYKNLTKMGQQIKDLLVSQKQLSDAVAHELRTPISSLRFSLELLKESTQDSQLNKRVQAMEADIDELDNLVAEILDYSQLERFEQMVQCCDISLAHLVSLLVKRFENYSNGVTLKTDLPASINDIQIYSHEKYALRAIENMLKNAARFAQHTVTLSVTLIKDKQCQIAIIDDGCGIAEVDRLRIFEPFCQLDSQTEGYGLGLAISKKIIDQQAWSLQVGDAEQGGAKFSIILPYRKISKEIPC